MMYMAVPLELLLDMQILEISEGTGSNPPIDDFFLHRNIKSDINRVI